MRNKIYRLKTKYFDYKYCLEYFDPIWQTPDCLYFTDKKSAKRFLKKLTKVAKEIQEENLGE